jgi:hypothetical protein
MTFDGDTDALGEGRRVARAHEMSRPTERPRSSPDKQGALTPLQAFFALLLVVAVVVGLALVQSDGSTPQPSRTAGTSTEAPRAAEPGTGPDPSAPVPTVAKARATFLRLRSLWLKAYRTRNADLIPAFAAPDARGAFGRIGEELAALRRDGVLFRSRFDTQALHVVSKSGSQMRLRERLIETPRFIDARTGRNVTKNRTPQRLTIDWTLRSYDSEWRIYRSLIIAAKQLGGNR